MRACELSYSNASFKWSVLAQALLEARADIEAVDKSGKTAWDWATAESRAAVLALPEWSLMKNKTGLCTGGQ